jgi:DNA-binding CsgD family transcriptional regulator
VASLGDSLPAALVLVGQRGDVISENELARILATGPGPLRIRRGCLVAPPPWRHFFDRSLADARNGRASSFVCDEWQVAISPLSADPLDIFAHMRHGCVVRVSGPAVDSLARRCNVRRRFGATATEAVVAELIADGCSVAAIAARLRRSPETVRTHLKRLFAKTGTSSQRALARTVRAGIL